MIPSFTDSAYACLLLAGSQKRGREGGRLDIRACMCTWYVQYGTHHMYMVYMKMIQALLIPLKMGI